MAGAERTESPSVSDEGGEIRELPFKHLDMGKFGLIRFPWKEENAGSNPAIQTNPLTS